MATNEMEDDPNLTPDERRFRLDAKRLALDRSFAKKWLPTLATIMVGIIAGMFSLVQHLSSLEETERARIEAKAIDERVRIEAKIKDEREWGFKVVDLYFSKRELFDFEKNPEKAETNLNFLKAVAPNTVKGILNSELARVSAPSSEDDTARLNSLAAIARVQDTLTAAYPPTTPSKSIFRPIDFTVYVQYASGDQERGLKAQSELIGLGYRVPGIEQVKKPTSLLQVRYYRPEQKAHAGELAKKLGQILGLKTSADNAVLLTSAKQLPGGILEVWLPAEAS